MVDNKPGAGGTVATREALRSTARRLHHAAGQCRHAGGQSLCDEGRGLRSARPTSRRSAWRSISPTCWSCIPSVPAHDAWPSISNWRKRPEGMDYGTAGVGSAGHLAGELLKRAQRRQAEPRAVPRRRAGDERPDGRPRAVGDGERAPPRPASCARAASARSPLTGAKRSPFDPDIPTIAEQGFPGYAATNWYAARGVVEGAARRSSPP